jgi:hypothetical protein
MESIAYKLYAYYIKVGDVLNSFKVNYDLLWTVLYVVNPLKYFIYIYIFVYIKYIW